MSTPIVIVNLALSHIGEAPNISSISPPEGSVHAEKAAQFYPIARDKCLEAHNWNFAVKRVKPAGLPNPPEPWAFSYAAPADMIRPISVRGAGFINGIPAALASNALAYANTFNANDDEANLSDFIVENGIIHTNAEDATLRYVFRATDVTKWTPHFVDAVSWLLASYLAGAITEDERIKNWAYEMYMAEMQNAQRADSAAMRRTNNVQRPAWLRDR